MIKNLIKHQLLIFITFCALIVALIIKVFYQSKAIVIWDEGYHFEWVLWIANSIRSKNWTEFFRISKESFHYPPLFLWIMALPSILFPINVSTIRLINLFFYILSVILIYFLAINTVPKHKKILGLLSPFLYMLSPMVINFSVIALREMVGIAFTILSAIIYEISFRKRAPYLLFLSLSLIPLSMIKYNFGYLLFAVILTSEGFEFIYTSRRLIVLFKLLILSIPYILFMYWWVVVYENMLGHFLFLMRNPANYTSGMTDMFNYLLFYPRALVLIYSPSLIMGLLIFISFIFGFRYWKNPGLRFMWLAGMINIILGTIHTENVQERYIFTFFPFILIVGLFSLIDWFERLYKLSFQKKLQSISYAILFIILVLIIKDFSILPKLIYAVGSYTNKVGLYNEVGFKDLWFDYDRSHWIYPLPKPGTPGPREVFEMIGQTVDLIKPVDFIGETNELNQPYRNILFADFKDRGISPKLPYSAFAVITDVDKTSKYYTYDYRLQHEWKLGNRYLIENNPEWQTLKVKEYPELGIKISIYAKN